MVPSFMLSHRQILRLFTTLIRFMRTGSQALGTLRLWREVIFLPMDYLNPNLPEAMLPISEPFLAYLAGPCRLSTTAQTPAIWAVVRKLKRRSTLHGAGPLLQMPMSTLFSQPPQPRPTEWIFPSSTLLTTMSRR